MDVSGAVRGAEGVLRFLGWDCAMKSLAFALVDVNVGLFSAPRPVLEMTTESFMRVYELQVVDLMPGRKIDAASDMEKIELLVGYMQRVCAEYEIGPDVIVVVEKQPLGQGVIGGDGGKSGGVNNTRSAMVSFAIASFFVARGNQVHFVSPKLKNKLVIGGHECSAKSTYAQRKAHTVAMMNHLATLWGFQDIISKIPRAYKDDPADALMEIFAFIRKMNLGPKKHRLW